MYLVLFLALGAVTNLIVAWGCMFFTDAGTAQALNVPGFRGHRSGCVFRMSGYHSIIVQTGPYDSFFDHWWERHDLSSDDPNGNMYSVIIGTGWPFASVSAVDAHGRWDNRTIVGAIQLPAKYRFSDRWGWERCLPYRPIWPWFAVNTLLFAAALWILLYGPFAFLRYRRWRRLLRGVCPTCKYPIGSAPFARSVESESL